MGQTYSWCQPSPQPMPQPWGAQLDPSPQPPCSAVPCTHRGKRSAGGRSSPGPADGPELQLVAFAEEPGHRTLASLRGTDQHHPQHLPLSLPEGGLPVPSSPWQVTSWHPTYVSHRHGTAHLGTAADMGAGHLCVGWALGDPWFCIPLPRSTLALHSTPWPPATLQHGRGKEQGPVCCGRTSPALKNKILSSVFLQVFPRAAASSG